MSISLLFATVLLFTACKKNIEVQSPGQNTTQQNLRRPLQLNKISPNAEQITIKTGADKTLSLLKTQEGYILDNDILLTEQQVSILRKLGAVQTNGTYRPLNTSNDLVRHWTNAIVPFAISPAFSQADANIVLQAITNWNALVPIQFRARTSESNYIQFMPTDFTNNSYIGQVGGGQTINLATSSGVDLTSAEHEIAHALGLYHEQSRGDRDNFISINWSNIIPSMSHNFFTYTQSGLLGVDVGAFDFNSIMLYPSFITDLTFVFNASIPVMTQVGTGLTWGSNFFISAGDVEVMQYLYGPPFARIEYINTFSNYDYSGQTTIEYSEEDVYIRLYNDEACTSAYTGSRAITYHYTLFESTGVGSQNSSGYTYGSGTVPSGTNSQLIQGGLVTRNYYADFGNPIINEIRSMYLRNGFAR